MNLALFSKTIRIVQVPSRYNNCAFSKFIDLAGDIILNRTATMLAKYVFRHVKGTVSEAGE